MSANARPLPPDPPPMRMSASHKALAGMIAFLILAKLVEMVVHIPFQSAAQVAVFSWRSVIFFVAIALLGSGFAHIVGFPGMWDKGVNNRGRIWTPLAIGIVFGVAVLALDRAVGFAHLYAEAFGTPVVPLPIGYGVLFYVFAAVNAAILYHLFALSFLIWFFGTLLLARRWPTQMFWVMAVLVALWEPLTLASQNHWALMRIEPLSAGLIGVLLLIYAMDLVAAILFRRFGFVAVLILRVSAIAVWHIIGRT